MLLSEINFECWLV